MIRNYSNPRGQPRTDPLNLVKVPQGPLSTQAQETIQTLEEQKLLKKEESKKHGTDSWMDKLDDWKSKRRSVQPCKSIDLTLSDSFEELIHEKEEMKLKIKDDNASKKLDDLKVERSPQPSKTIDFSLSESHEEQTACPKDPPKPRTEGKKIAFVPFNFSDASSRSSFSRGGIAIAHPSDEAATKKHVESTERVHDSFDLVKSSEPAAATIGSTPPSSSATSEGHSAVTSSFVSTNFTPKEAVRRSNTSAAQTPRPKSSMVVGSGSSGSSSGLPTVPLKSFRLAKTFREIDADVQTTKTSKSEVKTAQASVKKFNNIKDFFEKASNVQTSAVVVERSDSNVKGSKSILRSGARVAAPTDPKKRMSLGPGVLERTPRGSVAIANDKEFIIEEHFVDSSTSPSSAASSSSSFLDSSKFQKKMSDRFSLHLANAEPQKFAQQTSKTPTKVYSLSTDQENPTPTKADISLEDFKGMISVQDVVSPSSSEVDSTPKTRAKCEKKMDDDVFFTPKTCEKKKDDDEGHIDFQANQPKQIKLDAVLDGFESSAESSRTKEIHEGNSKRLESVQNIFHKDVNIGPAKTFTKESLEPCLKIEIPKDSTKESLDDSGKFTLEKISSGTLQAGPVLCKKSNDEKYKKDVTNPVGILKKKSTSEVRSDELVETHFPEVDVQQRDAENESAEKPKDVNSFSAKIDKMLEELKFFPSPSKGVQENEQTPHKSKLPDEQTTFPPVREANPKRPAVFSDTVDEDHRPSVGGEECPLPSRAKVGSFLEKKFSKEKRMIPEAQPKEAIEDGHKVSTTKGFLPKVLPKPDSTKAKVSVSLTPVSTRFDKSRTIDLDEGINLEEKAEFKLLDNSASRSKVELARKAKRRPPSIKGRSLSSDDVLNSCTQVSTISIQDFPDRRNGFHHGDLQEDKTNCQMEVEAPADDDSDLPPPSLPSRPPPDFQADQLTFIEPKGDPRGETAQLNVRLFVADEFEDGDSENETPPESSV